MHRASDLHQRKIIALEFNELCPTLLSNWMKLGELPNFKRFFDQSVSFTGMADVDNPLYLEPWIQWYSLHTGLSYEQHKVFHLTDGPLAKHPDIWSMLGDSGYRVASFASMNNRQHAAHQFYVPDPWCNTEPCFPKELQTYQNCVSSLVQENSTGGRGHLGLGDICNFVSFYLAHGFRFSTAKTFASQLFLEVKNKSTERWKRVPLLDILQLDLFRHYWVRHKPNFSTFFINSTAHFQHAYWHLAFPEEFGLDPSGSTSDPKSKAILHGYKMMDNLLAGFFKLEEEFGATLVLLTALSQHANPEAKMIYYRPFDVAVVLDLLGLDTKKCFPVMSQQYSLKLDDVRAAEKAEADIVNISVENVGPLFEASVQGDGSVYFGSGIHKKVDADARVSGFPDGKVFKFGDLMHELGHAKTGGHHPASVIWFKTGTPRVIEEPTSIINLVPTFIDMFGIDVHSAKAKYGLSGESIYSMIR